MKHPWQCCCPNGRDLLCYMMRKGLLLSTGNHRFFLPKACARILFAELIERWLVKGSVYLSPSYARSLIRYKNSIIATAVTATPTGVACVAGSTHVALSPDLDADRQDN